MLAGLASVLAVTSALASGPVYAGWPHPEAPSPFVVLTLQPGSARVQEFDYHLELRCGNHGRLVVNRAGRATGAVAGGRVRIAIAFRMRAGEDLSARVRGAMTGRLGRRAGSGTLWLRASVLRSGRRRPITRCSARRAWRASRKPGVLFAGVSDQREPVAVELSKTPVPEVRLHFAWRASCPEAPLWNAHDDFGGRAFALDAFGGFAGSLDLPLGHRLTRLIDVAGSVDGSAASGWAFVQQILSGREGGSCDTGRVRWSALTG